MADPGRQPPRRGWVVRPPPSASLAWRGARFGGARSVCTTAEPAAGHRGARISAVTTSSGRGGVVSTPRRSRRACHRRVPSIGPVAWQPAQALRARRDRGSQGSRRVWQVMKACSGSRSDLFPTPVCGAPASCPPWTRPHVRRHLGAGHAVAAPGARGPARRGPVRGRGPTPPPSCRRDDRAADESDRGSARREDPQGLGPTRDATAGFGADRACSMRIGVFGRCGDEGWRCVA